MPLEVIGAGYGRTGTSSLKKALEILGYPTYHMTEVFENPAHLDIWEKVTYDHVSDSDWMNFWEKTKYTATTDFPACICYQDYHRIYPNAKVILTVRDFDSWYKSVSETIFSIMNDWPLKVMGWVMPSMGRWMGCMPKLIWEIELQGKFSDKEAARKIYENYVAEVKRVIPKDQLLLFECKQGWEPLCKFLNKPIPNQPFPCVNETKEMKKRALLFKTMATTILTIPTLLISVAAWYTSKRFQLF